MTMVMWKSVLLWTILIVVVLLIVAYFLFFIKSIPFPGVPSL